MSHKICGMLWCIEQNKLNYNSMIIYTYQRNTKADSSNVTSLALCAPPQIIHVKQDITREDTMKCVNKLISILENLDLIQPRAF